MLTKLQNSLSHINVVASVFFFDITNTLSCEYKNSHKGLISSARQILRSFTSASNDRSFPPQEEILHNLFTSKFSLDLVSMTHIRSILHFPYKFQLAPATS